MGRVRQFWQDLREAERSGATPRLNTGAKSFFIFLANGITALFAVIINQWGLSSRNSPDLTWFYISELSTGAVLIVPIILLGFSDGIRNFFRGIFSASPSVPSVPTVPPIGRFLNDEWPGWSLGYRWLVTILTYISVTVLAVQTGGAANPFGQFPLAAVLLAPIIMTSITTKLFNLFLGMVYVACLFWATTNTGILALADPPHYRSWAWAIVAAVVLVISLLFAVLQDMGKLRRWRTDLEELARRGIS